MKIGGFGEVCKLEHRLQEKETYESKYEELDELGPGSFRVQNKQTKEFFYAKKVDLDLQKSNDSVLRNLKHQNIVAYVESFVFEAESIAILITELFEG